MQELMPGSRPELRQPLSQPVLHQLTVVMVESPLNPHGGVSAESSWRILAGSRLAEAESCALQKPLHILRGKKVGRGEDRSCPELGCTLHTELYTLYTAHCTLHTSH